MSKNIAWLAGLLEGEGTFDLNHGQPRIRVGGLDKDVIERAADLLKTRVRITETPKGKMFFVAESASNKAVGWMMTLYSLLGICRKARIQSILTSWKSRPRRGFAPSSIRTRFV